MRKVTLRGVKVPLSPVDLCAFYDITYYEKDFIEEINLDKFENIGMKDVIKY